MASSAFRAYLTLVPKLASGATSAISSALSSGNYSAAGKSIGGSVVGGITGGIGVGKTGIGSAIGSAVKSCVGAVVSAAESVAGFFWSSISAYGEYEQLVGGVETLFKDSADVVKGYANDAFATAGMSSNQYMETITGFSASLLQSLGNDTAAAAEYGNLAVTDMADNANKMGTSMETIEYAYQGFAKQNYTMLDNLKLGYGGTKEEMQRLIEHANQLASANGQASDLSIDSFADVVTAIHLVQEELGFTGTTAAEASGTIQGSISMMKAAWDNWLVSLSSSDGTIGQATENLADSIIAVMRNVVPVLVNIFSNIGPDLFGSIHDAWMELGAELGQAEMFEEISQKLSGFADAMMSGASWIVSNLPGIVAGITQFASVVASIAQGIGQVFAGIGEFFSTLVLAAQQAGDAIGQFFAPIGVFFTTVGAAIGDFFYNFMSVAMQVVAFIQGIPASIAALFESIGAFFASVFESIGAFFASIGEAVSSFVASVGAFFQGLWSTLTGIVSGIVSSVTGFFSGLWSGVCSIVGGLVDGVVGFFSSMWNGVTSTVSGLVSGVVGFFQNLWSSITGAVSGMWNSVVSGFSSGVSNAISTVAGLPGRICDFFAGAGTWLIDAGKSVIRGFIDGIKSMFSAIGDAVSGALSAVTNLMPHSPAKEGPLSGKGWTLYSGQATMEAFGEGIADAADKARLAASDAMAGVKADMDVAAQYAVSAQAGGAGAALGNVTNNYSINGLSYNDDAGVNALIADFMTELIRRQRANLAASRG